MVQIKECDGCGLQIREGEPRHKPSRITRMVLSPIGVSKYVPQGVFEGWTADLCSECIKRVSDPNEWARPERPNP